MDIITEAAPPAPKGPKESFSDMHFYLLKTGTTRKARVLISLDPKATLTEALRDRFIQEYPTIYALRQSPSTIRHAQPSATSSNFTLETDYLKSLPAEVAEVPAPEDSKSLSTAQSEPRALDANSILKMMRRDLTT